MSPPQPDMSRLTPLAAPPRAAFFMRDTRHREYKCSGMLRVLEPFPEELTP